MANNTLTTADRNVGFADNKAHISIADRIMQNYTIKHIQQGAGLQMVIDDHNQSEEARNNAIQERNDLIAQSDRLGLDSAARVLNHLKNKSLPMN